LKPTATTASKTCRNFMNEYRVRFTAGPLQIGVESGIRSHEG
jgi:hypothetical protein